MEEAEDDVKAIFTVKINEPPEIVIKKVESDDAQMYMVVWILFFFLTVVLLVLVTCINRIILKRKFEKEKFELQNENN